MEEKQVILVVDDDTRLRSLLQRFLRENNFMYQQPKMLTKPENA